MIKHKNPGMKYCKIVGIFSIIKHISLIFIPPLDYPFSGDFVLLLNNYLH